MLTGETFIYRFIVPRPGIFFYHSHIAPTNPSFKGYYGSIIVEEPAEQTLIAQKVLPDQGHTMTLVLGDTTVCKAAGSNDADTFPTDPNLPWVGTEELPGNPPPGLSSPPRRRTCARRHATTMGPSSTRPFLSPRATSRTSSRGSRPTGRVTPRGPVPLRARMKDNWC